MPSIVDTSEPAAIRAAIRKVNQTPGLRISPGTRALWRIFKAPNHTLSRSRLDAEFPGLDLQFGWFCRRIAEELGDAEPSEFALVDKIRDENGATMFALKPSVVAAMKDSL